MTDLTPFIAEAQAIAPTLPSGHRTPVEPCRVIQFPTPSQRLQRESREWMRKWARPMLPTDGDLIA